MKAKRVWADDKRRKIERAKARKIIKTVSGKWIAIPAKKVVKL